MAANRKKSKEEENTKYGYGTPVYYCKAMLNIKYWPISCNDFDCKYCFAWRAASVTDIIILAAVACDVTKTFLSKIIIILCWWCLGCFDGFFIAFIRLVIDIHFKKNIRLFDMRYTLYIYTISAVDNKNSNFLNSFIPRAKCKAQVFCLKWIMLHQFYGDVLFLVWIYDLLLLLKFCKISDIQFY